MAVFCKPVVSDIDYLSDCGCSLVDFKINIKNLCNHSKYGIVAQVVKDKTAENPGTVVATVCKVFTVNKQISNEEGCQCVEHTESFSNVIIDVGCCVKNPNLTVEVVAANYIYKCKLQ